MSDLISRQTAIDTIRRLFPVSVKSEYTHGITCGVALAMNCIEQLPPADPEESETWSVSFEDCSIALVSMLMNNVMTDLEYNRIMDKLIAREKAERLKA